MAYIKGDSPKEQERFDFLEDLRRSGATNMFGAGPYLQAAFDLSRDKATAILSRWIKFHDDPERILRGPSCERKVSVTFRTVPTIVVEPRKANRKRKGRTLHT